jgi:hypothetical protein
MARPNLKGLFPVAAAFIAFILTLLCLFAGTQRNLLDGADILTVCCDCTSTISHASSSPQADPPISQLYTPEGGSTSGIHEFYSIHVMSYCQGTLGTVEPGTPGSARNVTQCSDRQILFSFDPTDAWSEAITHGPTLEWPRVISDDFHAFRLTTQSMAVLYCIGVSAVGAVLLVRVSSLISRRVQRGPFEFGFFVVSRNSFPCARTSAGETDSANHVSWDP